MAISDLFGKPKSDPTPPPAPAAKPTPAPATAPKAPEKEPEIVASVAAAKEALTLANTGKHQVVDRRYDELRLAFALKSFECYLQAYITRSTSLDFRHWLNATIPDVIEMSHLMALSYHKAEDAVLYRKDA